MNQKIHWYDQVEAKPWEPADKILRNPASGYKRVTQDVIDLMHHFEGWHNHAYLDPVSIPTIGVGFIAGVEMGDYMTDEEITIRLRKELKRFKSAVNSMVKVKITQQEFDALVSFSYNLGTNTLYKSTLLSKLNNHQYEEASEEFPRWNKAGGRTLLGLQRRRDAERLMFLGKDWRSYRKHF